MSYKDKFRYNDTSAERRVWVYFNKPEAIYDLDRIKSYDRSAAHDIAELEALINDLKEYRQDLARRYAELSTMPYTYRLYLTRDKSYCTKKVTYTVRLARVLPDGKEIDERREDYAGTERKKAFDLFDQIKRQRPGIEAIQDTEKQRWEK